jgi:hypothetical protein
VNWDGIIAVSELIGVVAIIASLAYVGVQIRQSTSIARATIIHATYSDAMRMAELIVQDSEVAAIFHKGTTGESLAGTDLVRFFALIEMHLTWLEDVDSQFEADLFFQDEELGDFIEYMSGELASFFSTPEARQWWQDNYD